MEFNPADADSVFYVLRKINALKDCGACGKNDWYLSVDSEAPRFYSLGLPVAINEKDNGMGVNSERYYWALAITCDNCGLTRLHSVGHLEDKAEKLQGDNNEG